MSHLAFLELCRFFSEEFKEYSPKMFKSNLTRSLIEIQNIIKKVSNGNYDVFDFVFFLDPPKYDFRIQSEETIDVLYSKPFFEFLNEINHNKKSIFNDDSYKIVKNALTVQFLNEKDSLKQQNRPPQKFNGFDISIRFTNTLIRHSR